MGWSARTCCPIWGRRTPGLTVPAGPGLGPMAGGSKCLRGAGWGLPCQAGGME